MWAGESKVSMGNAGPQEARKGKLLGGKCLANFGSEADWGQG